MKKVIPISVAVYSVVITLIANCYPLLHSYPCLWYAAVPIFLAISIFAGIFGIETKKLRLRISNHGVILLSVFRISTVLSVIIQTVLAFKYLVSDSSVFWYGLLVCFIVEFLIFWNGMICVYLASEQLGIKYRVTGLLCGMVPILNIIMLNRIIKKVRGEVIFETEREQRTLARIKDSVCKTKYPILLVHGVFFRDNKYFNYWGRIPEDLELNGARIYYGEHHSAASIADCGEELAEKIKKIINDTGCEKVNIIAHSKGGLDSRYAIEKCGMAPYIASLTTINTPHRGCIFADVLLEKISSDIKDKVANIYNKTFKKLGEENPDFIAAVSDLTASSCKKLNEQLPTPEGIFCQSVGSVLKNAKGGTFPLNFSYHLVNFFDGPNDGLVSTDSFEWGEKYTLVTPTGDRGISHGDMIDLNRENIDGFDVRGFYLDLVSDLKNRGF